MGTIWKNELEKIQSLLAEDKTLDQIGSLYGVSKQRIYQILTKYGIETPMRSRRNYLRDKSPATYWLNHLLTNKRVSEKERMEILKNIEIPTHCPILGLELDYDGKGIGSWVRGENSPSLDQIIPSQGYVLKNVQIISWRANRIKNDATPEELMKIAKYMEELTNKKLQV